MPLIGVLAVALVASVLPSAPAHAAIVENDRAPAVSGAAAVDQVLTLQRGAWTTSITTSYSHRWERCTTQGDGCLTVKDGSPTYKLTPADVGKAIRVVEIADTGSGIREEDRERIFEAFRQVDGSSTRRAGGMGLGLSLARAIVELHGGKVWVESRLGAGSVFTVAVPLGD